MNNVSNIITIGAIVATSALTQSSVSLEEPSIQLSFTQSGVVVGESMEDTTVNSYGEYKDDLLEMIEDYSPNLRHGWTKRIDKTEWI